VDLAPLIAYLEAAERRAAARVDDFERHLLAALATVADMIATRDGEVTLSVQAVATLTGESDETVRQRCKRGEFEGVSNVGTGSRKHLRIPLRSVIAFQRERGARWQRRLKARGA